MIYIDFETRSAANLKRTGAWAYAEHPSTDVLCMAYAVDDGPVHLWIPGQPMPPILELVTTGERVEAHNAFFERAIWENIMVPRYGWPMVPVRSWRCSASKAAARALPRSLAGAGAALRASVLKNEEGRRVMMKLSQPKKARRKANKNDEEEEDDLEETLHWHTDVDDLFDLYDYCKDDVAAEREISKSVRDLPERELAVWQLDQRINARGVYVDADGAHAALRIIAGQTQKLLAEFRQITGGAIDSPGQRDKILEWVKSRGVELDGYRKQDVVDALALPDLPPDVRRVLEIRQQLGKTSTKKFERMLSARCRDGRLRDMLLYHGATTGRWSGRLVQLQNIPRGSIKDPDNAIELLKAGDLELFSMLYPDVMGAVASCVRGMLCATPGCDLLAADFSAIEARVLFWLAGDVRALDMYRQNADLYVDMARAIYTKPEVTKDEREMGKRAVLGCGYQMGGKRFVGACKEFANVVVTEEFATHVVNTYREKYPKVKQLWYAQEEAAITAVRRPGKAVPCGKVTWGYLPAEGVLYCKLPSGRALAYNDPQIRMVEHPFEKLQLSYMGLNLKKQWIRESTYGGKLVENITQAVARDLMAEAMLRLEAAGYSVILSVHDEVVSEVPEGFGSLEEFQRIIVTLPAWAAGCPVKAEGWRGKRYKK